MSLFEYVKRGIKYIRSGVPKQITTAQISYLQPNNKLEGKKIIITGGGSGLGVSMAKKFISEGADVIISGRNEAKLKTAAENLGCKYLLLDLNLPESFAQFIKEADTLLNGINCLVNNAGISLHEKTFFDVTTESFDLQFSTNLKGSFFLTQEFIRFLISENRTGNVLFTSSETGDTVDFRPYGFTKASINSMVQGVAYLFAENGIRVNAVAPGVTASDMTGFTPENIFCGYNHTDRVYLPEEVAETACFLLSDASGCISGQIITCNNAKTVNARWK